MSGHSLMLNQCMWLQSLLQIRFFSLHNRLDFVVFFTQVFFFMSSAIKNPKLSVCCFFFLCVSLFRSRGQTVGVGEGGDESGG